MKPKFAKYLFLILNIISLSQISLAATTSDYTCPHGITNDAYPGQCGLYVDEDHDNYCDIGGITYKEEPTPQIQEETQSEHDLLTGQELKTKTVGEVAQIYGVSGHNYAYAIRDFYNIDNVHESTTFQVLHDEYGVEPNSAKDIVRELAGLEELNEEETKTLTKTPTRAKYPFIIPSITLLLVYLYTYSLYKAKIIKRITHLRIWNVVLLFSFIICGILALLLIIRINYGSTFDFLPFNILYWHVEIGLLMLIVCSFHIANHYKYFLVMIKK